MRDIHLDDLLSSLDLPESGEKLINVPTHQAVMRRLDSNNFLSFHEDLCPGYKQWEVDTISRSLKDLDILDTALRISV